VIFIDCCLGNTNLLVVDRCIVLLEMCCSYRWRTENWTCYWGGYSCWKVLWECCVCVCA